ncbi:N-acetylmuramoyl-L-alanine amidase [hydrothermal vent metagenome]|uniref:N-acetylmuramoyl-L-alanine amidase n=1 Tax=hydrothermal vent metagenome TaxID=652676 RepID=A0A3B0VZE5_9ZZZZ
MKHKINSIGLGSMQNIIILVMMFLLLTWASNLMAKSELSKMRIGQQEDKTRVVFDLKGLNTYKVSQLSNPSRLVVDFYKTKNQLSFKNKFITDSRLFKVRVSNNKKRIRIVLDLHKHGSHNVFILPKNKAGFERLVVDLQELQKNAEKRTSVAKKSVLTKKSNSKKSQIKLASATTSITKKTVQKNAKKGLKVNDATKSLLNKDSAVLTKPKALVVAIDAGHGGKDMGATGYNKIQEKQVTLSMAKELKRLIDRQPGMRAVLTRDKDIFIPLKKRIEIAKKKNADIFISIHADAFHDHSVRGGSVYVLSQGGASSVMARLLAKSENASLQSVKLKGREDDVAFALSDLTREANIRSSRKLAKTVLGEMQKKVKMHKHSVQSAGFAVLKSIDMPSLLIETAFISNPHEARNLKSKRFQRKMASAIVGGLTKFVKNNAQKPRWGETLYVHYKVQRGDTLSQIAENHQVSTKALKKLNNIKNANELYVGKKVKIPLSEQVVATL